MLGGVGTFGQPGLRRWAVSSGLCAMAPPHLHMAGVTWTVSASSLYSPDGSLSVTMPRRVIGACPLSCGRIVSLPHSVASEALLTAVGAPGSPLSADTAFLLSFCCRCLQGSSVLTFL